MRRRGPLATEVRRGDDRSSHRSEATRKRTPPIDKKDLNAIVVNMVEAVMREQNVPEGMARALVGFALMKNTEGLVASIKNPAGAVQG